MSTPKEMQQKKQRFASTRLKLSRVLGARTTRKWGIRVFVALVIFGILGFFAVPPLVRPFAERQLGQVLSRPVSIGRIALDPFILRLEVDRIHVGEPTGADEFVGLDKLVVRASWSSLLRGKPIIDALSLTGPRVHIVRTAPQRFNFSDLIERFSKPSATPDKTPGKPTFFSVSNIRVEAGFVAFDDQVLGEHHTVEQLRLGIPFIANLPSKIDVFVQPLLQASIDGSPLSITGKAKPFSTSLESDVMLKLDKLQLPQALSYLPVPPPVQVKKGQLSTDLDLQFAIADQQPHIRVSGTVDLDDLSVTDRAGLPLLDANAIHLAATSIEPLLEVFHLAEIRIDRPVLVVSRDASGQLNLAKLAASPADHPSGMDKSAPAPKTVQAKTIPLDFLVQKFELNEGAVSFQDRPAGSEVHLGLNQLAVTLNDFSTLAGNPASYTIKAKLEQGGDLSSEGTVMFAGHTVDARLAVEQLVLPTFQPYLAQVLAARLTQGTLTARAGFKADWAGATPEVQLGPSELDLNAIRIVAGRTAQPLVALGRATAHIQQIDLSARKAELSAIELDELVVNAERSADGTIDLAKLVRTGPPQTTPPKKAPPKKAPARKTGTQTAESPWSYRIDQVSLGKSAVGFTDHMSAEPVSLHLSALQLKITDISQDFSKPWKLDLAGALQSKGKFAVRGTVSLSPLKLALHVSAHKLDVAAFEPYFGAHLNASIASALLGLNGDATLAGADQSWKVHYKGDAALGSVRMLDKTTSDLFAGWRLLKLSQIAAAYDAHGPDVEVGKITFSDFFAKIFLDKTGKLNLQNFVTQEDAPRQSLTRAGQTAAAPTPADHAQASAPAGPPVNLRFDEIDLDGGNVDYTDNFIKPNFSANLTAIGGQIGAFGTRSNQAAPVQLSAKLNSDGPVSIKGTINPLVQPPELDLTASATDIELTRFAAYSEKYVGYPIIKGKLLIDLHYALDKNQLTANNHLFVDQLTFGDQVDSPTATNLPVRLAISLLKNSRGEIDINVPVSGSLSDPQFSVGGLIWHAFVNLIEKAVTSPFSLLAGAFGNADELGYVEFTAGTSTLAEADEAKLATLNKALDDRPAIKLDLLGRSDPASDRAALKEIFVERQIKLQKIKGLVGKGESIDVDSVSIAPEEYEKYLARAYKAADFKKPSNLLGLSKSLPPEEMKKLLVDNTVVTDADLLALAQSRATAVQQWFDGKIDGSRIYVVAPTLEADDTQTQTGTKTDDRIVGVRFTLKR